MRAAVRLYKFGVAGYVRPIVTDAALLVGCAETFRAAGASEWHVDAPAEIRGLEAFGLQVAHRSTVMRLPWAHVSRLPAELAMVTVAEDGDDDDLERAFELPSGRIVMARSQNRVVLQVRDAALGVLGFAVFEPDHAPLFHVARPALAAVLLACLRRRARTDSVQVIVADDEALVEVLGTAGARIEQRLLHYRATTTAEARCA